MSWEQFSTSLPGLLVALVLGAAIGVERQWHHRTAGLKTNALVAVGAASYMAMGPVIGTADTPGRVAAQIISGIGFLGAGVILREGLTVRGLNTAATLWCSAAVGTLAGADAILAATAVALVVLAVNLGLTPVVRMIGRLPSREESYECHYVITIVCRPDAALAIGQALRAPGGRGGMMTGGIASHRLPDGSVELTMRLTLPARTDATIDALVDPVRRRPDVSTTRWTVEGMVE
jgi:putative Mg2+ transporter-C (MgtC) family protein